MFERLKLVPFYFAICKESLVFTEQFLLLPASVAIRQERWSICLLLGFILSRVARKHLFFQAWTERSVLLLSKIQIQKKWHLVNFTLKCNPEIYLDFWEKTLKSTSILDAFMLWAWLIGGISFSNSFTNPILLFIQWLNTNLCFWFYFNHTVNGKVTILRAIFKETQQAVKTLVFFLIFLWLS